MILPKCGGKREITDTTALGPSYQSQASLVKSSCLSTTRANLKSDEKPIKRLKNALTPSNTSIQRRDRLSADCAVLHPAEHFPGTEFNVLTLSFQLNLPSKIAFFFGVSNVI